jgi:triosephosphate isomerase (TIM)
MKKKYIFANWKSNKDITLAKEWVTNLLNFLTTRSHATIQVGDLEVGIFPPYTLINTVSNMLQDRKGFVVGSQDISPFEAGSHTGLICAKNLAGIATHVIVGHSEMRQYSDSDNIVNNKIKIAKNSQLKVLCCIRNENDYDPRADLIAYEPIEAIGTGHHVSIENIMSVKSKINHKDAIPFIYGGSVNSTNAVSFLTDDCCDGLLIGGASLDPKEFATIINNITRI